MMLALQLPEKKQSKLKNKQTKNLAFIMSTGSSIALCLGSHKPKCLLKTFFMPDKKRVVSLWHLSKFYCNKCSYSLFTTLYTLVFFACNKNTSSHKRANFREIKYLVHDNFFYWLESLFWVAQWSERWTLGRTARVRVLMGRYVVALSKSLHSPCFVFSDKTLSRRSRLLQGLG